MVERKKLIAMVTAVQNGDDRAITEMYETFQSDIYYFIFKTVNNERELAEDLTQDTFMEILETIHKLEEPAAFVTWSKQIAYHKCTAYFRKRKDLLVDENEDGYSVFDTIEEDREEFIPDAALDHDDLKETIMAMIKELPEEQRSAIILRYFNEISVKEIAEIQGVTEGTVKSRLNYGRKAIKQSVEAYEKKNDVKLHCAGVLPLLLWFFKQYRIKNDLSLCMGTAIHEFIIAEETAAAAGIVAAATVVSSATATPATVVTEAGTALTTKIVAGILAAAVTIGGTIAGVNAITQSEEKEQQPTIAVVEKLDESDFAIMVKNTSETEGKKATEGVIIPKETSIIDVIEVAETEKEKTSVPDVTNPDSTEPMHYHKEIEAGPYKYIYCSYVESPYKETVGSMYMLYFPYSAYYTSAGMEVPVEEPNATEHIPDEHVHNYVMVYEEKPTCTTCGYAEYQCECGKTYEAVTPNLDHQYDSQVIAATTEVGGYTLHTCSMCGDSYKDSYTDKIVVEEQPVPTDPPTPQHQHTEIKSGPYVYVYCSDVESPYKVVDGETIYLYYPYSYY